MARIFETRYGIPEFAQLIALGEAWRHHQDDFEGGHMECLGPPALPAALPLAAVKFQRNDDREQRRDCPRLCLIVQHSATIGPKEICQVNLFRIAAEARAGPRMVIEFRSAAAEHTQSANPKLPHQRAMVRLFSRDHPSGQFPRPETQPFEPDSQQSRVRAGAKLQGRARIRHPKLKINCPIRANSWKGQSIEFGPGIIEIQTCDFVAVSPNFNLDLRVFVVDKRAEKQVEVKRAFRSGWRRQTQMRVFADRPSSPLLYGTPAIVEARHPNPTGAECNPYAWSCNDAIRCFCPLQLQRRNI